MVIPPVVYAAGMTKVFEPFSIFSDIIIRINKHLQILGEDRPECVLLVYQI